MNQTIIDSEICVRGISIEPKAQNEKSDILKVIAAGEKTANFLGLEIEVKDGTLTKNNELITNNGTIKFSGQAYEAIEKSRKARKLLKISEGIEK